MRTVLAQGLFISGAFLMGVGAMAEEPEEPKTESELAIEAANQRKAESEAETAAENAEKARFEARTARIEAAQAAALAGLPDTETTGAAGTVAADETDYFPTILAHQALAGSAQSIADDISNVSAIGTYDIFMVGQVDVPTVTAQWRFVNAQLSVVESAVEGILKTEEVGGEIQLRSNESLLAAGTVLTALPQILGGVADIAAFFKVNLDLDAVDTAATVGSLDALIASRLVSDGLRRPRSLAVPGFALGTENALTARIMKLGENLANLRQRKARLVAAAARTAQESATEIARLDAEISELTRKITAEQDEARKVALQEELQQAELNKESQEIIEKYAKAISDDQGAALDTVIEQGEALITALATPDDSKLTPLQRVDLAASIFAEGKNPAILVTTLSSQGGARQSTTGGILSSGQISYLGGATVTFRLTDLEGHILAAGSYSSAETAQMQSGEAFPVGDAQ